MSINILMPALSPTMTEGSLAKWHKREGDAVLPGDVLAEIETDKATMEVEAVDEGILGKIVVEEGTEGVMVNQTIGVLFEEGEDLSDLINEESEEDKGLKDQERSVRSPIRDIDSTENDRKITPLAQRIADQCEVDLISVDGTGPHGKIVRADVEAAALLRVTAEKTGGQLPKTGKFAEEVSPETLSSRIFASPLARRMASKANIEIASVIGSGPDGRVIKRDIDTETNLRASQTEASIIVPQEPKGPTSEIVKLSAMRKVIARRMVESKAMVPHFYLTMDCLLDELLKVREHLNAVQDEAKISINDFVIRACGVALSEVPQANVAHHNEDEMLQFTTSDISVAVAIPGGLITPIVAGVEHKGLRQISLEMKDLASRARDGKLMPEEYQGGSFSISNLGMYGVKQFDAVINPPQACILGVGAGEQRPVIKSGAVVPATVMSCTLSVDHRVVDGAIGAELLGTIKRFIENPALMLL